MVQLNLPPPGIIEIDLVERLELILSGFVGSIVSLPEGVSLTTAYTETVTPLAGCMEQLPGSGLAPIRKDIPVRFCTAVSCIAK